MINKGSLKFAVLLFIFVFFTLTIYLISSVKSAQDEEYSPSNVTVSKQVAISRSNNLTAGILFGVVDPGSEEVNATGNFNSTGHTQYWITIDSTTNTPVDLCIKVDQPLTSGSYQIANTNYHYSYNDTTNDQNYPTYPATNSMDTNYVIVVSDKDVGGASDEIYFRFSLDIPPNARAGTYSNNVYFKAADNETSC